MAGTLSSGRSGDTERRTLGGREVQVGTDPDELYVEWRPGRIVYYRVRVGDRIKDADSDVSSPRIREWEVTEVTPERVVGVDTKSDEVREWDRETLERGLVVGSYATSLADFALVTCYPVGSWEDFEVDDGDAYAYHGRPYVTVVAYGDNGQKYGRRYRFVEDDNDTDLELWDEDVKTRAIPAAARERLDAAVHDALTADGYVVH